MSQPLTVTISTSQIAAGMRTRLRTISKSPRIETAEIAFETAAERLSQAIDAAEAAIETAASSRQPADLSAAVHAAAAAARRRQTFDRTLAILIAAIHDHASRQEPAA